MAKHPTTFIFSKVILTAIFLAGLPTCFNASAQCTGGFQAQIGLYYEPSCNGVDVINPAPTGTGIDDSVWVDVKLSAGVTYIFSSDVATDYLTISDIDGVVPYFFGNVPLTFMPEETAHYRLYVHSGALCTSDHQTRYISMQCVQAANDNPEDAQTLNLGSGCSGYYTNVAAHHAEDEPFASCINNSVGKNTSWFKFTAPASGGVKISTDYALETSLGPLNDTRAALFSATNASDWATFTDIACDDDNGITGSGSKSVLYASGLTQGNVYYIAVDGSNDNNNKGTFCITVDELTDTMLATGSCTLGQSLSQCDTDYQGWLSIVDSSGKLMANIRPQSESFYFGAQGRVTVNTGVPRSDATGKYYLDRNFDIESYAENTPVRFYFLQSELNDLQNEDPNADIENMNITRVHTSYDCSPDFDGTSDNTTLIQQTNSGAGNGIYWVDITTPDFSNFYINSGNAPLPIDLKNIIAENKGNYNVVSWSIAHCDEGDYFELEHSADGKKFDKISSIDTKPSLKDYVYEDKLPNAGINYYRLKLLSADGKFAYSKVVNATVDSKNIFMLQATPNPVKSILSIRTNGNNGNIIISDITGKIIKTVKVNSSELKMDMSNFSAGTYFLKYMDNAGHQQVLKVVKE